MSSQSLTDIVFQLAHSNPLWLSYPISHLHASLCTLSYDVLRTVALCVSENAKARDCYGKTNCISIILDHFQLCRDCCLTCSFETLQERLRNLNSTLGPDLSRFDMISTFFESTYGTPVALALRKPPWPILDSFSIPDDFMVEDMP